MEYTPTELREMLQAMQETSNRFYSHATKIGCHPFIEFCGLLNEYIKVCADARQNGQDFTLASTHTGQSLPFKEHHLDYLAEKLNCIYGPGLFAKEELRDAFIQRLFEGEYRLVPAEMLEGR